jgi:hypothetical protein
MALTSCSDGYRDDRRRNTVQTVTSSEDPMKSEVRHAWIAGVARPKLFAPIEEVSYGELHSQGELGPVQETSR